MKRLWRTTTQLSKHFSEASIGFRTQALISVAVLMGLLVVLSDSTHAYLTSRVSVPGNFISTLSFDDAFILSPGKARAVRVSDRPKPGEGASFLVARENEDGEIELDFGEVPRRNRTLWPDVIYVRSLADEPLALSFEVEGAIAPLIGTVRAGPPGRGDLEPGETRRVVVQADVGQADAGDYEGAVIVRVGTDWRFELPARLTVK